MNNITYILSAAVQSGKTTALRQWVEKTPKVTGFLTPDIDGKRMFWEIETGRFMEMEKSNGQLRIGKYAFNEKSFKYVEDKIREAWLSNSTDVIVLDEVGPLEIRKHLGFHTLLLDLERDIKEDRPNLLFVVRDYCLKEFQLKYKFNNVKILSIEDLKSKAF